MPRSSGSSSSTEDDAQRTQELEEFLAELSQDLDREAVASEIQVLQSIYGDDVVRLWHPPSSQGRRSPNTKDDKTIRYEIVLSLPAPHEEISVKILVSLPEAYPGSSPPQLQLLSKYIGPFGADSNLFGSILRTYISISGVEWSEDTVCVFDGLQNALELCMKWYEDRLTAEKVEEIIREDTRDVSLPPKKSGSPIGLEEDTTSSKGNDFLPPELPAGVNIYVAEPIMDRKSAFVGRACRIDHPSQVPQILSYLMADRRIARAAHPIINSWRCQVDGVLHQDNDDDGETAAGGRLAHLLQILDVNNVLVVVTRYFGGIHLGPDRFKHINQAARNALDLGGFLDAPDSKKNTGRAKRH
ncbi:UPF0029-domain-containing protein [Agrocybe pediades]|nr:UPF0029-domain-containing protein [Agrocybe pediades]